MPYLHSCFISYKHAPSYEGMPDIKSVWVEFVEALAAGVAKFPAVPLPPYYDVRLKRQPGIAYPEELSLRLCSSICLIAILQPEYLESRWCLAEWNAMEQLEAIRLGGRQGLI